MPISKKYYCSNCREPLEAQDKRCPRCRCKEKDSEIRTEKGPQLKGHIKFKDREEQDKKPIREVSKGWYSSVDKDKFPEGVDKITEIDKKNDKWRQIVRDKKTGEIVHEEEELLSEHKLKPKNKLKNKTIAVIGIGSYILSVMVSGTDFEGNSIIPIPLIILSGIATAVFIIMAAVRLWKKAKNLSIALVSSAIILFILMVIQEFTLPSYGSPIIILSNIFKVIYFIAFIWAIIKLFKKK